MKPKNIYDATGDLIGELHFMKNKNMFGLRFNDSTYQSDVTLSIDALPHYLKQFRFYTEEEVMQHGQAGR